MARAGTAVVGMLLVLPMLLVALGAAADERDKVQPVLDDATLQREYRDYRSSVQNMHLYHVSYIRVDDEAQARDLVARIRSGASFPEIARKHSIHTDSAGAGGDLGTHASCRWAKATLEMLDSLKRGQTWPKPVKGTHGWGIYRLESVTDLVPRSFEQYRQELLAGKFQPECPWEPPVTIAPARPAAPTAPATGQGAGASGSQVPAGAAPASQTVIAPR